MIGSEQVHVAVEVNGTVHERDVPARMLLIDFVREELRLTGAHIGCDSTNCGACTIWVDGRTVKSCTMFAAQADGAALRTVEGLADGDRLSALQSSFHEHGALQCGYCTPGMLMSATHLLERNPRPTRDEIKRGLAGNLCRCTGYTSIVDAVESVAGSQAEAADER
jgi:aerobic-type carbon monoxide dehydrogenase small subunit (CoxS/CutS family)